MSRWHVKAVKLPERSPVELWTTEDGRISFQPVAGAQTLASDGFVLPGLVDVHAHPGTTVPGRPLDEKLVRQDLEAHLRSGVTVIRVAGVPSRLPSWVMIDSQLPQVLDGGPWLYTTGMFFAGWGREMPQSDLPEVAVNEALRGDGWVKLRGDFIVDEATHADPLLLDEHVLIETVRRVHQAHGRVAIHAMHAEACRRAVAAGVDTLEHGMWLDHALLPRMAAQHMALTPTFRPWATQLEGMKQLQSPAREWFLDGFGRLGELSVAAHAAGVTILAGTDSRPPGKIGEEVRYLVASGLPPSTALGAACWTARAFFGLPRIEHGARADFVLFDADPLEDLAVLDRPANVVLKGKPVKVARPAS